MGIAQTAVPPPRIESPHELASRLTPEQNQRFQDALQSFGDQRYAEALIVFKDLLKQLPGDAVCSKFAAEAAVANICSGQRTQTHYTYFYFVGEPSYDVVREKFFSIAQGKAVPLSARTGLVVP